MPALLFVWRRFQDGDLADPGTAEGEGERATGLSAADDGDVVVDAGMIRHPVGGIRSDQAKCRAGIGVRIA